MAQDEAPPNASTYSCWCQLIFLKKLRFSQHHNPASLIMCLVNWSDNSFFFQVICYFYTLVLLQLFYNQRNYLLSFFLTLGLLLGLSHFSVLPCLLHISITSSFSSMFISVPANRLIGPQPSLCLHC